MAKGEPDSGVGYMVAEDAVHEISTALGNIGGAVLFLVSDKKKDFFSDLCNTGLFLDQYNYRWLIVVLSFDAAITAIHGLHKSEIAKGGSANMNGTAKDFQYFGTSLTELNSKIVKTTVFPDDDEEDPKSIELARKREPGGVAENEKLDSSSFYDKQPSACTLKLHQ
ncbi:hypothetical protein Droror1_Dr00017872 [Drosera rotundifolia]